MTDGDMFALAVVAVVIGRWLWQHPGAAKVIGLVVMVGAVGLGVAHAAQAQRHHRRGHGSRHHRRR
jgi:hypothetical protein